MSANTSVATPMRTGIVRSSLRSRYLDINLESLQQLRQSLPGEPERGRSLAAMPGRSRESGTYKPLLELLSGHVECFQTIELCRVRNGGLPQRRGEARNEATPAVLRQRRACLKQIKNL